MQIELEPVAQNPRGRPGEIDDRRPTEVVEEIELKAAVELGNLGR